MSKPAAPRLGKGLAALISPRIHAPVPVAPPAPDGARPDTNSAAAQQSTATIASVAATVRRDERADEAGSGEAAPPSHVTYVSIDAIRPNPNQPRTVFDEAALAELAASIRQSGVLQPVLVRSSGDGRYELVAGERRWRAARQAGLTAIPAIVHALSDSESLEIALIENLQRDDLRPLERAAAYQRYIESFGVSPEQLATRLGMSRANVVNYMRLLKLPPLVRELLEQGELGMGQARAIAGVLDPQRQLAIARLAARRNLSARQVEALVSRESDGPSTRPEDDKASSGKSRHYREIEAAMSRAIGLPVELHPGRAKNAGHLTIRYRSLEEFETLADRLGLRVSLDS